MTLYYNNARTHTHTGSVYITRTQESFGRAHYTKRCAYICTIILHERQFCGYCFLVGLQESNAVALTGNGVVYAWCLPPFICIEE